MLEGAARVKMFEEIALVRLIPAHLIRRQRADVETIDARRRHERLDQFWIFGDGGYDQGWSKKCGNLTLLNFQNARIGKKKLFHRERVIRPTGDNGRQHVR